MQQFSVEKKKFALRNVILNIPVHSVFTSGFFTFSVSGTPTFLFFFINIIINTTRVRSPDHTPQETCSSVWAYTRGVRACRWTAEVLFLLFLYTCFCFMSYSFVLEFLCWNYEKKSILPNIKVQINEPNYLKWSGLFWICTLFRSTQQK